jgi:hypothetical protein
MEVFMTCTTIANLNFVSFSPVPVVVKRLGWDAAARSIELFVVGSVYPIVCRTALRGIEPADVVALTASLRAARDSGSPVVLGARSGWSTSKWFCAVASPAWLSARAAVARKEAEIDLAYGEVAPADFDAIPY